MMVPSLALGLMYIGLLAVGLPVGAQMFTKSTTRTVTVSTDQSATPWTSSPPSDLQGRMFSMMSQSVVRFSVPGTPQDQDIYGFTVCLRTIAESVQSGYRPILTLTMSHRVIFSLKPYYPGYKLQVGEDSDESKIFSPVAPLFWSNSYPWTSLCVTWDSGTGMTQLFKDRHMSVRKGMRRGQKFSGIPTCMVTLSDFEGQVTDIHVWDKVLPFSDLRTYNQGHIGDTFYGNLLSWRDISYTSQGYVVLEDAFQIGSAEKGRTGKKQQRRKCRPGGASEVGHDRTVRRGRRFRKEQM